VPSLIPLVIISMGCCCRPHSRRGAASERHGENAADFVDEVLERVKQVPEMHVASGTTSTDGCGRAVGPCEGVAAERLRGPGGSGTGQVLQVAYRRSISSNRYTTVTRRRLTKLGSFLPTGTPLLLWCGGSDVLRGALLGKACRADRPDHAAGRGRATVTS
jgi:hypothetical protein